MARGRKRHFEDNAARQRAYRQRQAAESSTKPARPAAVTMGFNFVTQPDERRSTQIGVTTFSPATPGRPSEALEVVCPKAVEREFEAGTVCAHSDATGLLVRVVAMLDGGRVKAKVLQAGVTRLNAGHEYPFRADLLAEVAG